MTAPKHDKHDEKKLEENGTPTPNSSVIPTDIMDYLKKAFALISVGFTEVAKKILEYAYESQQTTVEIGKLFTDLVDGSKKLVELDQIAKVDTSKGPELEALKEQTEEVWKKLVEAVEKDQHDKDAKAAGLKKPKAATNGGGKVPPPVEAKKDDGEKHDEKKPEAKKDDGEKHDDEHPEHGNGGHQPPHPPEHNDSPPPPKERSMYPFFAVAIVAFILGAFLGANVFPTEKEVVKDDPRVAILQKRLAKIGTAARVRVPISNFETEKGISKAADEIEKRVVTVINWEAMPLPPFIDVPAEKPEVGRIIVKKKDDPAPPPTPAPTTADSTPAVEDAGWKLPDLGLDDEDSKKGNVPAPVVVAEPEKKNGSAPEPSSQDSFCASGIKFTPVRNRGGSGNTLYLVLPQRGLQGIPPWPVTCGRDGLVPDFREDTNGSWALDCVQGEGGASN